MKNSEYKRYTLLFDLTDLSDDVRELTLPADRVKVMYVAVWASYNDITSLHYFRDEPTYEEDQYVPRLNSDHWIQYQLIKHLPINQILNHFLNQSN